jgi:hypothetical protein
LQDIGGLLFADVPGPKLHSRSTVRR